jgi:hypothetical protein
MKKLFQQTVNKMVLNPKRLFLIDFFGAVLSAFLLGIVLVKLESIIGMPSNVLYILAILACGFAVYSFLCYLFVKENWQPFLKIIAIINLSYCLVTMGLVIYFYQEITTLGHIYFILEMIVIVSLVSVELKTASNKK